MDVMFDPYIEKLGAVDGVREEQVIKREPMLYSCDIDHAIHLGGPLTREALALTTDGAWLETDRQWIVDTRVHMLKPGFYPAIPGWHCDAISRGTSGQPEFPTLDFEQRHYTVILASEPDLCQTEFLRESIAVPIHSEAVWSSVDRFVSKHAFPGTEWALPLGHVWKFNSSTLHRAVAAKTTGWRYFFRLSEMKTAPRNEIRNQTQVYCDVNAGW